MLGRCSSPTLHAKNIPFIRQATRRHKRHAASKSYATSTGSKASSSSETSSNGSHASSSGRTSLYPFPAFRTCLFPSTPQGSESALLWQLSRLLTEKGDISRLVQTLSEPDNPIQTSNVFNALFARLRCLQDSIPPAVVLQAMQCATKDPTAMKLLLNLYHSLVLHDSSDREKTLEPESISWFEQIAKTILSNPVSQWGCSVGERTKRQWIWVLAGWDGGFSDHGTFPKPPPEREYCLFDLGPRKNYKCWRIYVDLLSMYDESRLLATEWQKFVAEEIGTTGSSSDIAAARLFKENLNVTISALIRLGDPGRAWSIAYEAGDVIELVDPENLQILLAHPDCIKSWRPEMNQAALGMLDTEIQKIERLLGLRWEGGQDGFHRIDE